MAVRANVNDSPSDNPQNIDQFWNLVMKDPNMGIQFFLNQFISQTGPNTLLYVNLNMLLGMQRSIEFYTHQCISTGQDFRGTADWAEHDQTSDPIGGAVGSPFSTDTLANYLKAGTSLPANYQSGITVDLNGGMDPLRKVNRVGWTQTSAPSGILYWNGQKDPASGSTDFAGGTSSAFKLPVDENSNGFGGASRIVGETAFLAIVANSIYSDSTSFANLQTAFQALMASIQTAAASAGIKDITPPSVQTNATACINAIQSFYLKLTGSELIG